MALNVLLIYEIKDKAAKVTSKKALREYERWIKNLLQTYHDAAVEQVARISLFTLKQQFSFGH